MRPEDAYRELLRHSHDQMVLGSCATLLEWDEDVTMPEGGASHRAEQQALLARLGHGQATDERLGNLLERAEEGLREGGALAGDPAAHVNVRELRQEWEDARLMPASLVEELARVTTLAHEAWHTARQSGRARDFLPKLERVVALKQAEADCVARGRDRYDVLLDEWEPGMTWSVLGPMLARIEEAVVPMIGRAAGRSGPAPRLLSEPVEVEVQAAMCRDIAERLGFDFTLGRLDEAVHPSTTRIGPGDVRITTRYDRTAFTGSLFATLHELGHGLYEQYLPEEHFGAPVGEAPSLGMHESQARLVENQLGRSLAFWELAWPRLSERAGGALREARPDAIWRAVNHVRPSLGRISADELTYDLHILVRVGLERALVSGDLRVAELPGAWKEAYRRLLGVEPENDVVGCLQDGHWAEAMIGYFPTYTIGNAISAQLMEELRRQEPDLDARVARGDLEPLLSFLRERVHRLGGLYTTAELVERATGQPLSVEPLVRYLGAKLDALG